MSTNKQICIQEDYHFFLTNERSELMSNKRINEGDNDSSSEEDNEDNNTTQQREDAVQQNSIDGTIEESQA